MSSLPRYKKPLTRPSADDVDASRTTGIPLGNAKLLRNLVAASLRGAVSQVEPPSTVWEGIRREIGIRPGKEVPRRTVIRK